MKKIVYLLICALFACAGCRDDENGYPVYNVAVRLVYPAGSEFSVTEGLAVQLTSSNGWPYSATTDANGIAVFTVPAGIYEASAADKRSSEGIVYIYNGITAHIVVTRHWAEDEAIGLNFTESKAGQVIIKELYVGGCKDNNDTKVFQMDKYVILYNNSGFPAELNNVCLGMVTPANANATNNDYDADGYLGYEPEGWIPAGSGIWHLPNTLTIEPYRQVVIALTGAIDHTATYNKSVNLANSAYYCTYDPAVLANTLYYPAPSELIPTSHYFSVLFYGAGNAWPLSTTSPAFFIFKTPEGTTPAEFVNDPGNVNYYGSSASASNARRKVPVEWILDGIEVFTTNSDTNKKRLTAAVDGGAVYLTNQMGYTSYRNVDKDATEAIEGNKGLLVYGYDKGTVDSKETISSDPNGIDAEASIANGARIVYMDTNNSTNDFHQRSQASLKDVHQN